MRTFKTPGPIALILELGVGNVRVRASERSDTLVEVRPSNPDQVSDVEAATQTRVEYDEGTLLVKAPRRPLSWRGAWRGGKESVDITVELPAGSQLRGTAGVAPLWSSGPLGACLYTTGAGDVRIEQAGEAAELVTGAGDISIGRAEGRLLVRTGTGAVRIESARGAAEVKNSNGDTWIGEVAGEVRVRAANGAIRVEHAGASVAAKTANGAIEIGDVSCGVVEVSTACGRLDISVRVGIPAWVDAHTRFGRVRSHLDPAEQPAPGEESVEIRARTSFGDIDLRRAVAAVRAGTSA
jgi:hypothetical protein